MTYEVHFADLQEQHVALVRGHISPEQIPEFLGAAFGEVASVAGHQGLTLMGPPFARYRFADDGSIHAEAGFPVNTVVSPDGRVEPDTLPGGTVARTLHVGPYDQVAAAYEAAGGFVVENGYEATGLAWECYLDEPEEAMPRTEVFLPCRPLTPHGHHEEREI